MTAAHATARVRAMPAQARAECRRAYEHAKRGAGLSSILLDRWYAETLLFVEGQRAANAIEAWKRTRMLFDLIADRQHWREIDKAGDDDDEP